MVNKFQDWQELSREEVKKVCEVGFLGLDYLGLL